MLTAIFRVVLRMDAFVKFSKRRRWLGANLLKIVDADASERHKKSHPEVAYGAAIWRVAA
jgi:hypothetical protein